MELSNPQLLHVGVQARLTLKEWSESEEVSVNAIVVSALEEFFKRLKKSKALREELRREIRGKRRFMASLNALWWHPKSGYSAVLVVSALASAISLSI